MTGYLTIILYWRNKTKQNRSPSVFNIQAPTNPLSGARWLPEKIALESNILNRGRGGEHALHVHTTMHKIQGSSFSFASCVPLCQQFESLYSPLFKYHSDIAKTGDKSSLRCRFLCNSFTTVFKSSTRYIWRVNVHDMCFAWFSIGVPELCPFLKLSSI